MEQLSKPLLILQLRDSMALYLCAQLINQMPADATDIDSTITAETAYRLTDAMLRERTDRLQTNSIEAEALTASLQNLLAAYAVTENGGFKLIPDDKNSAQTAWLQASALLQELRGGIGHA